MLFFITASVLLVSAQAKLYTDCGSVLSSIESVGITGCSEDAKECVLKRNTNVTISVDFVPSADVTNLETVVHGYIMSLPVPFPVPQPDACKNSGLSCPIKSGTKSSYRATFPILRSYPKVSVDVKWELQNEAGKDLVCVLIPARIN